LDDPESAKLEREPKQKACTPKANQGSNKGEQRVNGHGLSTSYACSSLLLLDFSVFVRSLQARLPYFYQRKSKWVSDSKRKLKKAKQHLDGYSMERTTPIVQFSYLQTPCEFLQRNLNLARFSGGFSWLEALTPKWD